jgi:hypothetical protein
MSNGLQKAVSDDGGSADVRDLELLAHYERGDARSGGARSGFAVILELTDRRILLENDVSLEAGDALRMNFFLPDAGQVSGRLKVSLECRVTLCRDAERLHYGAAISKIGEASRQAILSLQSENRTGVNR